MNSILSVIYQDLLEHRLPIALSQPDYQRASARVDRCMEALCQALPAEEQELPEQFWDACSELHLIELEAMFQAAWTTAREIWSPYL